MFKVSYSKLSKYLRCGEDYRLTYEENIEPISEKHHLFRGNLIHYGLETAILAVYDDRYNSLIVANAIEAYYWDWNHEPLNATLLEHNEEIREEMDELVKSCILITQRVVDNLGIASGRWETIHLNDKPLIEETFGMHMQKGMYNDIVFEGIVDWVARDRETGHVWLIDWKTRKSLNKDEHEEVSPQLALYQHMVHNTLDTLGICQPSGTAIIQIRAEVPQVPKLLKAKKGKSPTMSRAMIKTTPGVYSQALRDEGLDPADYVDTIAKLNDFERITFTHRTPQENQIIWDRFTSIAYDARETNYYHMNRTPDCLWCDKNPICEQVLTDGDVEYVKRTQFKKREKRGNTNTILLGDGTQAKVVDIRSARRGQDNAGGDGQ